MEQTPKNKGGRPKGSGNRLTAEIKLRISDLIKMNWDQAEADLRKMTPQDRWTVLLKLMPCVTPQLRSIDATVLAANQVDQLSPAEVDRMLALVMNGAADESTEGGSNE